MLFGARVRRPAHLGNKPALDIIAQRASRHGTTFEPALPKGSLLFRFWTEAARNRPAPGNQTMPRLNISVHGNAEPSASNGTRRMTRPRNLLAVASSGGHWTELLRLRPAFEGCEVVYATTNRTSAADVPNHSFYYIPDANRWNKPRLAITALRVLFIVLLERPDVIISTGAAPGYFALLFGKMIGARTLWLESLANAEELSLSTKFVRKYADEWLTQWPQLAAPQGPVYKGSVL